jgi:hypothetical protein
MDQSSQAARAAELTVLALRAMQPIGGLSRDRVIVEPATGDVSTSDAVRALAEAPKPVVCSGRVVKNMLSIIWRSMTDPEALRARHETLKDLEAMGGLIAEHRRRTLPNDADALCVGSGESLLVSVAVLEEWQRDYDLHQTGGWACDEPGSMWADMHGLSAEGRASGAALILKFFPPNPEDWISTSML